MLVPSIGPIIRQDSASECNGAGYAVDVGVNKAMKHLAAFQNLVSATCVPRCSNSTIANRQGSGHPKRGVFELI
ncbi:hypothetical protein JOE50_004273 [Bradyrhizobium japonicum]|nr:hypothetical protein [Bradyrhizobium japonicum]